MTQVEIFENRTDIPFRTWKLEVDRNVAELKLVGRLSDSTSRVYSKEGLCPTIVTCQGGSQEPKILDGIRIRKLTPRECG